MRRKIVIIASMAMCLGMLNGCGNADDKVETKKDSTTEVVTEATTEDVTEGLPDYSGEDEDPTEKVADKDEDKKPGIDIDFDLEKPVDIHIGDYEVHVDLNDIDLDKIDIADLMNVDNYDVFLNLPNFIDVYNGSKELTDEEKAELIKRQLTLFADLQLEFKKAGIDATIDLNLGEVYANDSILFAVDSYELNDAGKEYLQRFLKAYSAVVFSDKYVDWLKEIRVEGNTDPTGSYDHNKTLSENRAQAVMDYCLSEESGLSETQIEQYRKLMNAYGNSCDKPVYNSDGTVNNDASRRVTFKFVFNID